MKNRVLATAGILTLLLLAEGAWVWVFMPDPAEASRNSSGTMAAINGPYVSGTVISVSAVNARLADIEAEISDSKSRSGKGDFSAPVRAADGTVASPAFAWTSETGSGLYRIGASDLGVAVSGSKKLELTGSLFTVTPDLTLTGKVSGTFGIGAVSPHSTSPLFVIGAGSSLGAMSRSGLNTRLGSNTYWDGSADKYNATGFAGILELGGLTSADFRFYTAPSGTGGNSATFTERLKVNESGTTFSTGIGADGSGFKHFASAAGCSTAASVGATCTTTVSWTSNFPDTNYTPICSCVGTGGGVPFIGVVTRNVNNIGATTIAATAAAATCTSVICVGIHN